MNYNKEYFEKVFSTKRMERYFNSNTDEKRAITHYCCNIELAESFYPCLSIFEVSLRNALSRELQTMTGREDWYVIFSNTPGLTNLNRYITQASKQITGRHETITPSKIVAELTLGFWVSLLNSEYEKILWKHIRRAFPYMPKSERKRKNVSAPLNMIRAFRNRVFHNESICWNLDRVSAIHQEIITVMGWINDGLPKWIEGLDRFEHTKQNIINKMNWD